MKKITFAFLASLIVAPVFADETEPMADATIRSEEKTEEVSEESEFLSDEKLEEGFLTHYLNDAIEKSMPAPQALEDGKMKYGRTIKDFISAPKIGGYAIGSYKYSDQDASHGGEGFNCRLLRVYVDGTILKDFTYRIQLQFSGTPHIKDFFVEWAHWKEFKVKVGQFKRAFTFEDPYNPWDVGTGDYSQLTKYLSGMGDYCGEANAGGRDQGIQIQGDLLPIGKDSHRLIHYQVMLANGQGINCKDANGNKDIMGTLQFQPIKNLYIGIFGWTGKYSDPTTKKTDETYKMTVDRKRWAVGIKYETTGWSARAEYAHSTGHSLSEILKDKEGEAIYEFTKDEKGNVTWLGTGKADAWYATVGIPCTPWLKTYLKYDAYRNQATWSSLKSIYSIAPNFQIHKNLMLQVQYNYVNDKTAAKDNHYNEIWAETYFRF